LLKTRSSSKPDFREQKKKNISPAKKKKRYFELVYEREISCCPHMERKVRSKKLEHFYRSYNDQLMKKTSDKTSFFCGAKKKKKLFLPVSKN
jgi:hypothetical protein